MRSPTAIIPAPRSHGQRPGRGPERMPRRRHRILALAGLVALGACASTQSRLEQSEVYYAQAKYFQAYQAANDARRENPDDPRVERQFWRTRLALLLEQGRELTF